MSANTKRTFIILLESMEDKLVINRNLQAQNGQLPKTYKVIPERKYNLV